MSHKDIYYSDKYTDEIYEYRYVVLLKEIAKLVPKNHLMMEDEWRAIRVQQSQGWQHYMMHGPVFMPKEIAKLVPKNYLVMEDEWRAIGVQQSQGWQHYMIQRPGLYLLCIYSCGILKTILPAPQPVPLSPSASIQTTPPSSFCQGLCLAKFLVDGCLVRELKILLTGMCGNVPVQIMNNGNGIFRRLYLIKNPEGSPFRLKVEPTKNAVITTIRGLKGHHSSVSDMPFMTSVPSSIDNQTAEFNIKKPSGTQNKSSFDPLARGEGLNTSSSPRNLDDRVEGRMCDSSSKTHHTSKKLRSHSFPRHFLFLIIVSLMMTVSQAQNLTFLNLTKDQGSTHNSTKDQGSTSFNS